MQKHPKISTCNRLIPRLIMPHQLFFMPTSRLTYIQDLPVQRYPSTHCSSTCHLTTLPLSSHPRLMPSNQPPLTPASTQTAASNQGSDPSPWRYKAMLHLVSHDTHTCTTCSAWQTHYMKSAMDDEPTLVKAENQHRDVIRSDLIAENLGLRQQLESLQCQHDKLKHKNNLQLDTTMSLCHELDVVCVDLEDTCRRLRSADNEIIRMCNVTDNIEHKADKAIDKCIGLSKNLFLSFSFHQPIVHVVSH